MSKKSQGPNQVNSLVMLVKSSNFIPELQVTISQDTILKRLMQHLITAMTVFK